MSKEHVRDILSYSPQALHSVGHVADYLGVTPATVRNRVARRFLSVSCMAGRRMFFTTAEIRRYIKRMKELAEIRRRKGPDDAETREK